MRNIILLNKIVNKKNIKIEVVEGGNFIKELKDKQLRENYGFDYKDVCLELEKGYFNFSVDIKIESETVVEYSSFYIYYADTVGELFEVLLLVYTNMELYEISSVIFEYLSEINS